MTIAEERYKWILEHQVRVIAAGLIAEMVNQPDREAMIGRAMEVFQDDISTGISRLIGRVEEEFGFDFQGVLESIADDQQRLRQTEFDVRLEAIGPNKINVIKVVRAYTGLGLKEAKELVESGPVNILTGPYRVQCEQVMKELEQAGATASVK